MRKYVLRWMFFLLASCLCGEGMAQKMAVKTNGLFWINCTPNLSMEFVMGKRSSVDVSAFYTLPADPFHLDVRGGSVDYRYWIAGRQLVRSFVGVSVGGTIYTLSSSTNIQMGDAGQVGLIYGYVLPLSKHWNVEFVSGFGVSFFRERHYKKEVYNPGMPYNVTGHRFLPTKLGISICYTF